MIPTMLPSGGFVSGFDPTSGTNSNFEEETNPVQSVDSSKDALSQLADLAKDNPEYMETYLQLLAERENTTNAQAWYERMSGSQYQRAAEDLRKAGLNPALALTALSGAGSGSVAPAGSWSTSPYGNKVANENAKSQRIQAGLKVAGLMTTSIMALAMMLL